MLLPLLNIIPPFKSTDVPVKVKTSPVKSPAVKVITVAKVPASAAPAVVSAAALADKVLPGV